MRSVLLPGERCVHSSFSLRGKAPQHRQGRINLRTYSVDPSSIVLGGVTSFLDPVTATIFSAVIAIISVSLNLYGSFVTERRKAEIQIEFEREKAALDQAKDLRSVIVRYRGPLLEATIDMEQRIYHLLAMPPENSITCEEEVTYTLFTMAQFLGILEIKRREGPRESNFLQGSSQGSDTKAAMIEAFRFVMSAHAHQLLEWYGDGNDTDREHPGVRSRRQVVLLEARNEVQAVREWSRDSLKVKSTVNGRDMELKHSDDSTRSGTDGTAWMEGNSFTSNLNSESSSRVPWVNGIRPSGKEYPDNMLDYQEGYEMDNTFRLSRGMQRAIGAMVNITPSGASRHYTMSYSDFFYRFHTDPYFSGWLKPLYDDIEELVKSGERWKGQSPFPFNRWTRLLLLQQFLMDAIDLLDPFCVRLPAIRRSRLSAIKYRSLPNVEKYLDSMSKLDSSFEIVGMLPSSSEDRPGSWDSDSDLLPPWR